MPSVFQVPLAKPFQPGKSVKGQSVKYNALSLPVYRGSCSYRPFANRAGERSHFHLTGYPGRSSGCLFV